MSATDRRGLVTYETIVAAVEEAHGKAIMDKVASPNMDPHAEDLPIRDSANGEVVAYVPADFGPVVPIAINGYVVGYYKETAAGREFPLFTDSNVADMWWCGSVTDLLIPYFENGVCIAMVSAP